MKKILQQISNSIRAKYMAAFLIVLIIPLFLIIYTFTTRFYAVLRNKEQDSISEKVSFAGSEFDRIFSDMDQMAISLILDSRFLDILASSEHIPTYEWFENFKSVSSRLALLNSNADYRYNITVLSYDNKLYHSGAVYNTMLKSHFPIIKQIREGNGDPVIFNRPLDGFDDTSVITLGRAVFSKGKYLGSILIEVPIRYLDGLLQPFDSESTRMFVLKDYSHIVYSSDFTEVSDIPDALQEALKNHATSVTLDGQNYLLQQLDMQQKQLSAIALVTSKSVFRESRRIISFLILGCLIFITATVIVIFVLTSFFTHDITALNTEVSRFGTETAKEISLPVHSTDEVGQLTEGVISMSHRITRLVSQIQENERNKRILEFNSLQAQINPHMIYNTLNTITYLAEVQNITNIREISSSFAYLLRSLSNQGEFISIAQEIEYLNSYISIKKYNLLANIQTEFQVDEEAMDCRILKLILQPIVENAIIHGFSNRLDDCLLTVSIQKKENLLNIEVADNGNGMDEETIQQLLSGKSESRSTFLRVGVKNILDRLQLQYGNEADFSIVSAPDCGTTVSIRFPAEYGFSEKIPEEDKNK